MHTRTPYLAVLVAALSIAGCDDDDPVPLTVEDLTVKETEESFTASLAVKLSKASERTVTIRYRTEEGTATAGQDFDAVEEGVVQIKAGEKEATLPVVIRGDTLDEADETFTVRLTDLKGAESDDLEVLLTITDNDEEPTVGFANAEQSVAETVGSATVVLTLSAPSGFPVSVPWTVHGTAGQNLDWTTEALSPLEIPAGESEGVIALEVIEDTIPEGGETLIFEMGTPTYATAGELTATTLVIAGQTQLNDTGVTTWSDDTQYTLTAEPETHPGQDASHGLDAASPSTTDGAAGFSFTKLDAAGNPLASTATDWSCVRDNNTGLVWEHKTPLTDPPVAEISQAGNYQYTWYSSDPEHDGGSPGATGNTFTDTAVPVGSTCAYASKEVAGSARTWTLYCNTEVYRDELNLFGVCGFKDWRLPEAEELKSLVNFNTTTPAGQVHIDTTFFPNIQAGPYLSATPYADGSASAWCIDMATGETKLCNKQFQIHHVLMVRSGE